MRFSNVIVALHFKISTFLSAWLFFYFSILSSLHRDCENLLSALYIYTYFFLLYGLRLTTLFVSIKKRFHSNRSKFIRFPYRIDSTINPLNFIFASLLTHLQPNAATLGLKSSKKTEFQHSMSVCYTKSEK